MKRWIQFISLLRETVTVIEVSYGRRRGRPQLISNIQHQHPRSREDSNLKVQLTKKRRETFWSLDLDVSLDLESWMLDGFLLNSWSRHARLRPHEVALPLVSAGRAMLLRQLTRARLGFSFRRALAGRRPRIRARHRLGESKWVPAPLA